MQLPNIPPEMVQEKLLFSAAPPAMAAGAVLLIGTLAMWLVFGVWRKTDWRKAVPCVAVLALAAGLMVVPYLNAKVQGERKAAREVEDAERVKQLTDTYKFEETFPLVPDGKWWHWGLYAILLGLLVEFAARIPGVPVAVGHLFRGVAAGVIASAVLPADWQRGADRWVLPLTAAVMAGQWAVLDAVSRKNPGGTLAACMAIVAGGAACVAIHDGSARFTDFATFLASSLAVLALGGWILRADVGGGVAVVPVVIVLLMVREEALPSVADDVTQRVPVLAYWLVGLAPLVLALFLLPPVTRFGTKWYSAFVKLLLVLIPVGVAVYLCLSEAPLKLDEEKW
jgi:hypothetical protein